MMEKIIAVDLDGTLAQDNAMLSIKTIEDVKTIARMGYKVIITTGRSWLGTRNIYEICELDTPLVMYSGAYVYLPKENKVLKDVTIPKEYIFSLLDDSEFKTIVENIYVEHHDKAAGISDILHASIEQINEFKEKLNFNPTALIINVPCREHQEMLKTYMALHSNDFAYRYWGNNFGEIYNKKLSKKEGIEVVLDYYHLTKKDLIFFGDGQNDIEILEYANTGVAMKNARDYVKEVANEVTDYTNNEDGVVRQIFKKLNVK